MDVRFVLGTLVLLVSALIFIFLSSNFSLFRSSSCYELNAMFDNASGLSTGSDVFLSGVRIGRVTDVSIEGSFRVHVTMCISERIRLPSDSVATISAENVLSTTKNISIDPGASDDVLLPGGVFEETRSPLDIERILRSVITLKLR